MPSRRALLAGAAGVGAAGIGFGSQLRLGPLDPLPPNPDKWPVARFDAANTAANRAATPPDRPAVAWESAPLEGVGPPTLVVDDARVYVSRVGHTAALDRASGQVVWTADVGGPLALTDGTLYVAPDDAGDGPRRLRAFDAATGDRRWTRSTQSEGPTLRATPDVVLFGGEAALEAFDAASGQRRWSDDRFREAVPAVAGGRLHALSGLVDGDVGRYQRRRVADAVTRSPPDFAWLAAREPPGRSLAITAEEVVCSYRERPDVAGGWGLRCLDPRGRERWRVLPLDEDTTAVGPLAVADGHCVATVEGQRPRVEVRRLLTGAVDWTVDGPATAVVVAGETVLLGFDTLALAAYALDGSETWRVDLPVTPAQVAAVDGAVFVASPAGQVLALR